MHNVPRTPCTIRGTRKRSSYSPSRMVEVDDAACSPLAEQSGRRDQSAHLSRVALVQHRQRSTDPCRSTDTSAAPCMVMGLTGVGTYQRTRRRLLADGWALGRRSRPRDARLCARPMRQICTGESAAQSVLSNRAQVSEHMQFQRVHGVVQVSQSADVVSLLAISFMTALPNGGRCLCP